MVRKPSIKEKIHVAPLSVLLMSQETIDKRTCFLLIITLLRESRRKRYQRSGVGQAAPNGLAEQFSAIKQQYPFFNNLL